MTGRLRRNRGAIALAVALGLTLLALALIVGGNRRGTLDPDGYDPQGAHALAVLLHDRGVEVVRTQDVPGTLTAATPDATLFLPLPWLMSDEELYALAQAPSDLVVTGAPAAQLAQLGVEVRSAGASKPAPRDPGCTDPVAVNAGRALTGGARYAAPDATSCYGGSLVRTGQATLLGTPAALTNEHLDEDGNAALALGLLSKHSKVVWLVPSPTRTAIGSRPLSKPDDLLPRWLHLVRWQLFLTLLVVAVWRGRRLGRVVLERLPVVVRASETVEGHGRLYHVARSRDVAGEALRERARRTLGRVVHGGVATEDVLVDLVAARSRWDAPAVRRLLYGPAPQDDTALVQLAANLDTLTHDVIDETSTRQGAGT